MKVIEEKKIIKSTIKLDDEELKLIKDNILFNKFIHIK